MAVHEESSVGVAAFLRAAHGEARGRLPDHRCTLEVQSIRAGAFAASASIVNAFKVDATALFFATPSKAKQHMRAFSECGGLVPTLVHEDVYQLQDKSGSIPTTVVQCAPRCRVSANRLRSYRMSVRDMVAVQGTRQRPQARAAGAHPRQQMHECCRRDCAHVQAVCSAARRLREHHAAAALSGAI